jgi:hypothetical protein
MKLLLTLVPVIYSTILEVRNPKSKLTELDLTL